MPSACGGAAGYLIPHGVATAANAGIIVLITCGQAKVL